MTEIQLRDVSNRYILKKINLTISNKELFMVLGPSGAGKTTLLKTIAGLVSYEGSIFFDGEPIDPLPPEERKVGYVPQDFTLFPHMTVEQNIAYGLRVGKAFSSIHSRVEELLDIFSLRSLRNRYPRDLSGGEKQRVAIARALAILPRVLLLDEPLSNLDPATGKYVKGWLKSLIKEFGITTLWVTHDISEVEELGDRVGILYNGVLEQVGKLKEILSSPKTNNVIDLLGLQNVFEYEVVRVDGGFTEVEFQGIRLLTLYDVDEAEVGKILIHPQDIVVSREPVKMFNTFEGVLEEISEKISCARLNLRINDVVFVSELPLEVYRLMNLRVGEKVFITIRPRAVRII